MLKEIEGVRQIPEDGPRRWFVDDNMDLIVWYDENHDNINGFQLCYDKKSVQRCLTWQRNAGGNGSLSSSGRVSFKRVFRLFQAACPDLPQQEKDLVLSCLKQAQGE